MTRLERKKERVQIDVEKGKFNEFQKWERLELKMFRVILKTVIAIGCPRLRGGCVPLAGDAP